MDSDIFKQGEEQYSRLKAQLDAAQITQQQFDAAVRGITVADALGQTWTMDTNGTWQGQAGSGNAPNAPQARPVTAGVASARPASPGSSRLVVPLIAGCLVLLCLAVVGGVFLFIGPAALQLAQGLTSDTVVRPPTLALSNVPVVDTPPAQPTQTAVPLQAPTLGAPGPTAPVQAPTAANPTAPVQVPPVAATNPTTPAGAATKAAQAFAAPTNAPAQVTNDCGVITQQEANQLLGVPADMRMNETGSTNQVDFFDGEVSVIQSSCSYDEGTHLVTYNVYKPDQTPPDELARLWSEYKASDLANNQSVPGIGDDAFVSSGILKFKKGNYYVDIIVIVPGIDQSGPASDPKQLELEKSFAQKAIARLPK